MRLARVLLMIHRLWKGGGTETHVLTLARQLKNVGHTVGVYTRGGPWVGVFEQSGLRVHVQASFGWQPTTAATSALIRTVRTYGYQLIHAHDTASLRLAGRLGRSANRAPLVMTVHGPYAKPATVRRTALTAAHVIAVSPQIRTFIIHRCNVPPAKVTVVPNGVSTATKTSVAHGQALRRRLGIPNEAFVIGYSGRFTFDKVGLGRRVIRLLQMYVRNQPRVYVLVAGRNSKVVVPRSKHVIPLGHVATMSAFYRACDVTVCTGRTAMESLACDTPTIAVGVARNVGLITKQTLRTAHDTNFGDHGPVIRWADDRLSRDIGYVRLNAGEVCSKTVDVGRIIRTRYDLARTTRQTELLYTSAIRSR